MRSIILLAACAAGPALAAPAEKFSIKPLADARVRYEHVDQDGLPRDADALTARLRAGAEARAGGFSMLVEGEGTLALIDRYNDAIHGPADRPVVLDPENIELNRAQLSYAWTGVGTATAGRQRIQILDQRFVGSVGFRQNEQTFDAVRATLDRGGLKLDLAYAWSVRTINGIDGRGARQQAVSGDNLFAVAGYATPVGTLSGFAFLVDQDEAQVQGFRLASQSYGLRFAGSRKLGKATLSYAASWAVQSDHHRNPNDYSARYYLAEAGIAAGGASATLGYEVLGADEGIPLTSFQTPLATLFKFQGAADKFAVTPPNGVRDLYLVAGYGWKKQGPFDAVTLSAAWHRFDSDRLGQHYGDEIDLLGSVALGRYSLSARYARYRADEFATDTDKFWLTAEMAY